MKTPTIVSNRISTTSTEPTTIPPSSGDRLEEAIDAEIDLLLNSTLSTTIISNEQPSDDLTFDEQIDLRSATIESSENDDHDVLLRELQKLTLKINQKAQLIKERDAEIKRLKLTMIGLSRNSILQEKIFLSLFLDMPVDETTREYILHLANKIRHSSAEHKYTGNLLTDAKRLGLKFEQLNQSLDGKHSITATARDLCMKIIPESERQVDHWNQLKDDVLLKERIFLGVPRRCSVGDVVLTMTVPSFLRRFLRTLLRTATGGSTATTYKSDWLFA